MFVADPQQYATALDDAGIAALGRRALFEVRGPDAAELLQGQLTNDIAALSAGAGCYALLLTHKARIRADMRVLCFAEDGSRYFVLESEPQAAPVLRHMLTHAAVGLNVTWRELSEQRELWMVVGPCTDEALAVSPPSKVEHSLCVADGAWLVRTYLGVDLFVPSGDSPNSLLSTALPTLERDVIECLRIEHGRPRLGLELGSTTMPAEAGVVERAVSFTKGCYVGQEPVARLHYRGRANRLLRGLRLASAVATGAPVRHEGREVGRVGSCARSPRFGVIGLALLRREVEPGTRVAVDASVTDGESAPAGAEAASSVASVTVSAEVSTLPFTLPSTPAEAPAESQGGDRRRPQGACAQPPPG